MIKKKTTSSGTISIEHDKNPKIDELYVNIFENFKTECGAVSRLNQVLPTKIKEYFLDLEKQKIEKINALKKSEKKELHDYVDFCKKIGSDVEKGNFQFKHRNVYKIIVDELHNSVFEGRFQRFVRVNSLILLVSEFEYFLTRIFDLTFSIQPNALKSKDKKISYEDFLNNEKMDGVINKLIDKELDLIMQEDIDHVANILKKKFKLDLPKRQDWKKFSEIFYRRNLLVHTRGKIDRKYLEKTKSKITRKYLIVDEKYLTESISIFLKYAADIGNYFIKKFHRSAPSTLLSRHQIMCIFLPEEHESGEKMSSSFLVHHKS